MTGLYMDYSTQDPTPLPRQPDELDLTNPELEIEGLRKAVYTQSHLEGLEVVCTTPMSPMSPTCPTHILPRPTVTIPDQGPSWFALDSEYGSTHTPNTLWYRMDDAMDAETVYENSDCEREAYDYILTSRKSQHSLALTWNVVTMQCSMEWTPGPSAILWTCTR
eukprot:6457301-Amphidinium_carterae.1